MPWRAEAWRGHEDIVGDGTDEDEREEDEEVLPRASAPRCLAPMCRKRSGSITPKDDSHEQPFVDFPETGPFETLSTRASR